MTTLLLLRSYEHRGNIKSRIFAELPFGSRGLLLILPSQFMLNWNSASEHYSLLHMMRNSLPLMWLSVSTLQ